MPTGVGVGYQVAFFVTILVETNDCLPYKSITLIKIKIKTNKTATDYII